MTVPRALAEGVSDLLHTMMNYESMEECQNGKAVLADCEPEVFAAFFQYCYMESYKLPLKAAPIQNCRKKSVSTVRKSTWQAGLTLS